MLSHHGGQDIFGSVVREENTRPVRVGAFEAFNDFVAALEANDLESITHVGSQRSPRYERPST